MADEQIPTSHYGVLVLLFTSLGAAASKVMGLLSSKDDRVKALEDSRFNSIMNRWDLDRAANLEQQRQTAASTKELADAIRKLSVMLEPVPKLAEDHAAIKASIEELRDLLKRN